MNSPFIAAAPTAGDRGPPRQAERRMSGAGWEPSGAVVRGAVLRGDISSLEWRLSARRLSLRAR